MGLVFKIVNRSRSLMVFAVVAGAALVLTPFALRVPGTWLVVDDPLQPSHAVVVFGGEVPFRAMEAAAIYKQGWTREVWITTGANRSDYYALTALGIDRPSEQTYSKKVLERLGVPGDAIRVLPEAVANTSQEVHVIAEEMKRAGGGSVILVTSKYHTRRVKVLWRRTAAPGSDALVRYARADPFVPQQWWRNTGDVIAVAREWVGLINALVGSPIESVRD